MPTIRHPFASIQYVRNSLSTDALTGWRRGEYQQTVPSEIPPVPPLPPQVRNEPTRRASPRLPHPSSFLRPSLNIDVPIMSSRSSPGHFVKHSSKITLLLSGQEEGTKEPEYTSGSTIDGILAVPRPSGLLSLQVLVEGTLKLKEIAGSGSYESDILRDSLFTWDSERNASFPSKVTFRYTLPAHYTHPDSRIKYRIPPTYEAHLSGIPGFQLEVTYAIIVNITRVRDKSDWWRKSTRLRIPFRYRELSRPSNAGPFPVSLTKTPSGPKTLFKFALQSRRRGGQNVNIQLFLPASQVCTMKEPIPFFVTLFADEDTLAPFTSYRPSPASFHPLSATNSSSSSIQQQIINRTTGHSSPVRLVLLRNTQADALAAGMPILRDSTHMVSTKTIARGMVHSSTRNSNSVTWAGAVVIPQCIRNSGFTARGIKVTDCLSLTIIPPDSVQADFMQFNESVPVRLTTETHDCYSAAITVLDSAV